MLISLATTQDVAHYWDGSGVIFRLAICFPSWQHSPPKDLIATAHATKRNRDPIEAMLIVPAKDVQQNN